MKNSSITTIILFSIMLIACKGKTGSKVLSANETSTLQKETKDFELTNLDHDRVKKTKTAFKKNKKYEQSFKKLLEEAGNQLDKGPYSVTFKSDVAPSGDKRDYLSIAPYWWPDPKQKDGLPWIRKDGKVNPITSGPNTDKSRKRAFFNAVESLGWAAYLTEEKRYATKVNQLLYTWFIDPETKMNPNLDYAQGVPGRSTGRGFGIIEFGGITNIITALELLEITDQLDKKNSVGARKWLSDYLDWLQHSELGVFEKTRSNNHAVWYDVQVINILMYLNRKEEARNVLEAVKSQRIATQIEPDGKQPHELARTKSLSYSTMNLKAFTKLAYYGQKLGVDLWNWEAKNGASIQKAYQFLKPYASEEKKWTRQQISSLQGALGNLKQLFKTAGSIFNEQELCDVAPSKNRAHSDWKSLLYPCNN